MMALPTQVVPLWRPLHVVWIAWGMLALGALSRRPLIWGLTGLGLAVRLSLSEPARALPHGKCWGLSMSALGMTGLPSWRSDPYGDAWESAGSSAYL